MGHTPGTWAYFKSVASYYSVRQVHPTEPRGVWVPVAEVLDTHAGTGEANARLIAAAPELLEACEAALVGLCDMSTPKMIRQVEEAIAKAKEGSR